MPGTFFLVGAGNEDKGITFPHHHSRFTVDEDALENGVKMFVNATFRLLDSKAGGGA
jgi:amidohydrolase